MWRSTNISKRYFSSYTASKMRVVPVPVRSDNYAYLLIDEPTNTAAVVDPYDVQKVIQAAEEQGVAIGELVITTHHHDDHAGGNNDFKKKFPQAVIRGGSSQCQGMTKQTKDGENFTFGQIDITAFATPCHTQDSICYLIQDKSKDQRGVFTGDTLFVGGCGRFFEGTGEEMDRALNITLTSLPDDTITYVGHEYTLSNAAFGLSIEPSNTDLQNLYKFSQDNKITTGKFTIADEKKFNVFMRLDVPEVATKTGVTGSGKIMDELRRLKNNFRG